MKNFLINDISQIKTMAVFFMFVSYSILLLMRIYNKKQAKKINRLFTSKYKLPLTIMENYLNQSIFFLSYVEIVLPLWKMIFFKKTTIKERDIEYLFIKELSTKMTLGFKIEAAMRLVGLICVLIIIIF